MIRATKHMQSFCPSHHTASIIRHAMLHIFCCSSIVQLCRVILRYFVSWHACCCCVFRFLFVGVSSFLLLFLVWGVGAKFVSNLIGFAYPLYESYRTLALSQSGHISQQVHNSQAQWLTYWIIYGIFTLVESLTDFFLYWIPLYHLVKVAFLVWCFLPNTRGAEVIYVKIIEPILVRYEVKIDNAGREGKRAASRIIADVSNEIAQAESKAAQDNSTNSVQGEQ